MRISGRVFKGKTHWIAEIPILNVVTQGFTLEDAFAMVRDLIETLADRNGFSVHRNSDGKGGFEVSHSEPGVLIGLMLQKWREDSDLSIGDVTEHFGVELSKDYSMYERGESSPTIEEFYELHKLFSLGRELVLIESRANREHERSLPAHVEVAAAQATPDD